MEEKENVSVFGSAIKTGLMIGLCFVLLLVLMYIIDVDLLATPWLPVVALLIITVTIIIFGVKFRNQNGGYLSYGKAFLYCILAFASATLLSSIFNILLFTVIDPDLVSYIGDINTENTIERLRSRGRSEAGLNSQYELIRQRNYDQLSPKWFLIRYFILLLIYAVFTLLTTLIVKKSKPIEDIY